MEIWNQFGMVLAVLATLVGALFWLNRRGYLTAAGVAARPAGKVRELKVIDKIVVSAQHTLVLVEVKETRLLVCLSPAGASTTVLRGAE